MPILILLFSGNPAEQKIVETKAIASEKTELSPFLSAAEVKEIAKKITVKVIGDNNGGSGTLIAKKGDNYLVLTNARALRGVNTVTVVTSDGEKHPAEKIAKNTFPQQDLALIKFKIQKKYQVAKLDNETFLQNNFEVIAAGYIEEKELIFSEGKITIIPDKSLKEGYQIGYSSEIQQGMSGGPILNAVSGKLIGINGVSSHPIVDTGLVYEDGIKPPQELIQIMRESSWGIPIQTVLARLQPEFLSQYSLPQVSDRTVKLTGIAAEIDKNAREITVRIEQKNGQHGSGVIIAKQNNSYYILTAYHVLKNALKNNITSEIITTNGQRYKINYKNVTTQPGVDLAVVKFDSNENYQVATLANYQDRGFLQFGRRSRTIFVAGWPEAENSQLRRWKFSAGGLFPKEQSLIIVKNQTSLSQGYDLVYDNITYGGMSGGPVLDIQGRVIGIHGLAEGEISIDQSGLQKFELFLGNSLGMPIETFLNLTGKLKVDRTLLSVQESLPPKLSQEERESIDRSRQIIEVSPDSKDASLWLRKGNQLRRTNRNNEAIAAYNKAIDLNPPFLAQIYYAKGIVLRADRKFSEADIAFSKALEIKPDFAEVWYRHTGVLLHLKQYREALNSIDTAIRLDEENFLYYMLRGITLSSLKRYSDSTEAYNKAIKLRPSYYYIYILRGGNHYQTKEFSEAIKEFNIALDLKPNEPQILVSRGAVYLQLKEYRQALADFNSAIEHQDNPYISGYAYLKIGNIHKFLKAPKAAKENYTIAKQQFNKAIELESENSQLHLQRGYISLTLENNKEAIEDFNKALKYAPENAQAYYNRGLAYFNLKEYQKSITDTTRSIKIQPDYVNAYYSRSNAKYQLGDKKGALEDLERIIKIHPDSIQTYLARGRILAELKQYQKALQNFNKVISSQPENATAYLDRARVNLQLQNDRLVIEDTNTALKYQPDLTFAYYLRGFAYLLLEDDRKATENAQQLITLQPDLSQGYLLQGLIYYQQKDYTNAISYYNQALAKNKQDPASLFGLGLIKYETDDITSAIALWQQARESSTKEPATRLALAVGLYQTGEQEKAIEMAKNALKTAHSLAKREYLQKRLLWGDRLLKDSEELFSKHLSVG